MDVIISLDGPQVVELKMKPDQHRSTVTDDIVGRGGKFLDVEWSPDAGSLAFVSVSRDHHRVVLRVADAATGEVRDVLEEETPTFFESGYNTFNWRFLPESNEVIWFSERDNWGHLYLYDLSTGKLKNRITSGSWNVLDILRLQTHGTMDDKCSPIFFVSLCSNLRCMIKRGVLLLILVFCVQGLRAASFYENPDTSFLYGPTGSSADSLMRHDTLPEEVYAKEAESLFGKLFKYMPVPYLGYSTETNLTFGIIKYNAFKFHSRHLPDSLMQLSNVSLYGFYTLNKQYEIKLKGDLMFGPNRFNTVFEFAFRDFPMLYYGVGNNTPETNAVLTDFKNLLLKPGFNYNIVTVNYIGFRYTFNNFMHVEQKDTFPDLDLEGNEGIQSGFGIKYFREGRNNRLQATKGSYIYLSYDLYSHIFGSKFDYGNITVDLRKYFTLFKQLTFAGQLYSEIRMGEVPVQSLAQVGGQYRMRGIYRGRFRDKSLAMAQLEMRFPIFWVVGGAVFGGMGQVQPHLPDFKGNGFHYAGGGGLRILMDKATSSVLRIDIGFSKGGHTVFLGFGEAF